MKPANRAINAPPMPYSGVSVNGRKVGVGWVVDEGVGVGVGGAGVGVGVDSVVVVDVLTSLLTLKPASSEPDGDSSPAVIMVGSPLQTATKATLATSNAVKKMKNRL